MAEEMMDEITKRANLAYSNQMEMLTFFLTDEQQYGVNVFKIIEVIETPDTITEVPMADSSIVGAINFRGHMVTAIDLSKALGMTAIDYDNDLSYIIVCEYSGTTQGLLISQPNKLVNKSWEDIKQPSGTYHNSGYLTAIAYDGEEAIQILDIEKILAEIIGASEVISEELLEQSRQLHADDYKVLVIDDSKAARELVHGALDKLGVKHDTAESAIKGLEVLERAKASNSVAEYCLIICDIEMPGLDGFSFTRKVKADEKLKDINLVLHSSMSNPSNKIKAKKMGADGFLPKFHADDIANYVLTRIRTLQKKQEAAA